MAERVGFEPTVPLRVHDLGRDPAQDRQDEREAPTVADLAERYLAERGPRKAPKTLSEDRSILKRLILPRLGRLKVGHVRVDDVEALHRQLVDADHGQPDRRTDQLNDELRRPLGPARQQPSPGDPPLSGATARALPDRRGVAAVG